ncbi:NADPH-dependent FMN reductase [Flavobacterium sp.]|uniref:NADPH-dependent FMN reductase n=1 Tax=Flavobacterium sp. TaxID=239 RepID=UPI003C54A216
MEKKNILAIIGSASSNSTNLKLVEYIENLTKEQFDVTIYNDLKSLPHFDPELSEQHPPAGILAFRNAIQKADGILISTPEYIFSIPSGLKNAIEWCIATTLFTDKPTGLITASASGQKGHEELQLIMKTAMAKFTDETTLLISGIKGKFDTQGTITNPETQKQLTSFVNGFINLIHS